MNPRCPKCGRPMKVRNCTTDKGILELGQPRVGMSKFWVCPNQSPLHGTVKYKVGSGVIPPYRGEK